MCSVLQPAGVLDVQCFTACWSFGCAVFYNLLEFWMCSVSQPAGVLDVQCFTACWSFGCAVFYNLLEFWYRVDDPIMKYFNWCKQGYTVKRKRGTARTTRLHKHI